MSTSAQVEGGARKPKRWTLRAFGWALMIGLGLCLVAAISADGLGLRVGSAADFLETPHRAAAPVAALAEGSSEPLDGTTITIWFLKGPRFFSADTIFASDLSRGRTQDGRLAYHIAFDEAGFNQYMRYWFFPSDEDLAQIIDGVRNPRIDLRPGAVMLYVDLNIGSEWKPAGLLYELEEGGKQLKFRGIQMEGQALTTAPDSFLDKDVGGVIERLADRALRELTFIDQTGAHLTIHQISIDDDKAEVLAVADSQ